MSMLFFVTSCFLFLWTVRNILFWVALWQDKEYRLDRLLVHFSETIQGKRIFTSVGNITKLALFVLGFFISSVKVNGKIAAIDSHLKSGDVVEILKSRVKKTPNKNWLRFVKTHKAKEKLRKALEQ